MKREKWEGMNEFFMQIWNKTPHNKRVCYETGVKLKYPPLTTYFHHVLEKSDHKYKKFAYKEWNIVLLHPDVHTQVHIDIDKTPKVKALREQLLKNPPI